MGTVTGTSLRWTLLSVCLLACTPAEHEVVQVNVTVGETAVLPCEAPKNSNITVVEWSRPDLKPECVFLYRHGQTDEDSQNPVFKERVELQDRQMKDGDVNLKIKNVTTSDAGTYECRVQTKTKHTKRAVDPISIITLRVDPPGQPGGTTEDGGKEDGGKEDGGKEEGGKEEGGKEDEGKEDGGKEDGGKEEGGKEDGGKEDGGKQDGSVRLRVGLIVAAVLVVVVVVGLLIYRKHKQSQDKYHHPPKVPPV